jgi:hypothetical protein
MYEYSIVLYKILTKYSYIHIVQSVERLGYEQGNRGSIPDSAKRYCLLHNVQTGPHEMGSVHPVPGGKAAGV